MAGAVLLFTTLGKPGGTSYAYPQGNRVVRIRPVDDTGWLLQNYTTADVLGWISDLRPSTLNRFTSGPVDSSLQLPGPTGGTELTALEFLQAALDRCENPNPTTMFPRLTFNLFTQGGQTAFLKAAQLMYDLHKQLNPPQTLLSIDNFSGNNDPQDAASLSQNLFQMGWTGLAWGACGARSISKGVGTYAMICVNPTTGAVDYGTMQALQATGGYGEFEAQIDFPAQMSKFSVLSPDSMADILTSLAQGQSSGGYHYMYPIIQERSADTNSTFAWDSTQIFTSQSGKYSGLSLYQVMKDLMGRYN